MKRFAVLFVLVFLLPLTAHSQGDDGWAVAVFADGTPTVTVLTADGISHTIPAGMTLKAGEFPSAPLAAISHDRRALAALNFTPEGRLDVSVAATGTCCIKIGLSDRNTLVAQMGFFSLNGRHFAVSHMTEGDGSTRQFDSAIVVIDVERGAVVARLEGTAIGGDFAWLQDWNDAGIGFVPLCYNCDETPSGLLARWNPETDEIQRDLAFVSRAQDILPFTGEVVAPARRGDYPLPGTGQAPNVVTFNGRVVYYNPRNLVVDDVHWVADGWQILVEHPGAMVLVERSGVQRPVAADDQFLIGTPDGWLGTRSTEGGTVEVIHHTLMNLSGEVVARFYHPVVVLQAAPLGATATQGGFPDAASPVSRITCPNAPPPRLVPGGRGRVIGGGVYLRRQPSVEANSVVMITREVFDVIGGPNCDPTGIAWWEVAIGGLHGWMAESRSGTYLLEPVLN